MSSPSQRIINSLPRPYSRVTGGEPLMLIANIVTTSKAPVTTSDALVPSSFLLLLVRHLLLLAWHLLLFLEIKITYIRKI